MKKKLVAIAAAAVAMVPLIGSPASAGTADGQVVFECIADLPAFPSGGASGTCGPEDLNGDNNPEPATAVGTIQGVTDDNTPFVLVAAPSPTNLSNFSATFNYQEGCVAGEPPVLGTADGTATITGLTGVVGTTPVTGGQLKIDFTWTRGGLTAAILIDGGTLTVPGKTFTANTIAGGGTAAFAPILTQANTCPTGGGLKAVVTGAASVGGANV